MTDRAFIGLAALLGGGGALWFLLRSRRASAPDMEATMRYQQPAGLEGWVWPAPQIADHAPTVSDGFGSQRGKELHVGVDIDYQRASSTELVDVYPPGSPNGTRGYFMPDGVFALSVGPGKVVQAKWTRRGFAVVVDHVSVSTFYTHLSRLLVSPGESVIAGQPLGIIGADPTQGPRAFKHLHFEVWPGGSRRAAIDPMPALRKWAVVSIDKNGRASLVQRAA